MYCIWHLIQLYLQQYGMFDFSRGRPVRDRILVEFTTTCAISAYLHFSREF